MGDRSEFLFTSETKGDAIVVPFFVRCLFAADKVAIYLLVLRLRAARDQHHYCQVKTRCV